ncbi:hypothetical protein JCM17039_16950 [Blautia glucerasea]
MDFQELNRLADHVQFFIMLGYVAVGVIHKKKKKRTLKKWIWGIAAIMLVPGFLLSIIRNTVSFSSLEEAMSFYGKTNIQGQPVVGKETAFVPELNRTMELNIYSKKHNKWILPGSLFADIEWHIKRDHNTIYYTVGIMREENTGSYYIILMDDTEKSWKKRNVRDTENSSFTYLGHKISENMGDGIYYSYLPEKPEDYRLYINDYEINVDWEKLFNAFS